MIEADGGRRTAPPPRVVSRRNFKALWIPRLADDRSLSARLKLWSEFIPAPPTLYSRLTSRMKLEWSVVVLAGVAGQITRPQWALQGQTTRMRMRITSTNTLAWVLVHTWTAWSILTPASRNSESFINHVLLIFFPDLSRCTNYTESSSLFSLEVSWSRTTREEWNLEAICNRYIQQALIDLQ